MQYGPAPAFPRAYELPAGPPSDDAMLVTCAYLVDASSPWVLQSLFLAAIGEARDRGAGGLETFSYRYPEGESATSASACTRRCSRRTSSPTSASRSSAPPGASASARLELGGLQPVVEGTREKVLRVVKEAFLPEPVPAPPALTVEPDLPTEAWCWRARPVPGSNHNARPRMR